MRRESLKIRWTPSREYMWWKCTQAVQNHVGGREVGAERTLVTHDLSCNWACRVGTNDTCQETGVPSSAVCPTCWTMGTQEHNVWWGKNYFVLSWLEQPRQGKSLLYRHGKPNEPTKEVPLSFVLFESPFTSMSTVSKGHPSLVSLVGTCRATDLRPVGPVNY
jgi:hypothetical protein